jgi:AraC-like DNA-binding protein
LNFSTSQLPQGAKCSKLNPVMNMNPQHNICKFIAATNHDRLYTRNFVFEKNAANDGTALILPTHAVYLVVSGKGALHTRGLTDALQPGNVFFTFAQIPFRLEHVEDFQYLYISFGGGRSDELFSRFGIHPGRAVFDGHEGLLAFWQNAILKATPENLDLISESVLLYTFSEISPPEHSEEQSLFSAVLTYIDDHYTDSNLNLSAAAQQLGYNSKYISRIFKNRMGITFSAYLTNVRIQNAVFLMEQGVTAIKNVALLSGYKDPLYFSNVFKKAVGLTPSEYIRKKESKACPAQTLCRGETDGASGAPLPAQHTARGSLVQRELSASVD